jgi:uncharacterized protein (DUF433 family)
MTIDIRNQSLPTVIVRNPEICGGDPTIRGTRIPVEMILVHLRGGYGREEIFCHYPRLPLDGIEAVIAWAEKNLGPNWRELKAEV